MKILDKILDLPLLYPRIFFFGLGFLIGYLWNK